jgi:PAS domain S-box-containing protein
MVQRIRVSERRFRELFDNMSSGGAVFETADDGKTFVFRDFNRAGEKIASLRRQELIGRPLAEVFPAADRIGLPEMLKRVWRSGQPEVIPTVYYDDGRIAGWREGYVYKLSSGEVVALFDDVSQRKATEEQLRQALKMEAIGQLTGGIAHDFNNVLAIIVGNLQLLDESLQPDPETRDLLSDALWSAERGAALIRRLLSFARAQPLDPKPTNLNERITGLSDLLRRTLGTKIEIKETFAAGLWTTLIDHAQFETALINLVVNARDAMPDGGTLTIATANETIATQDGTGEHQESDFVMLSVSDTGTGMAPEVRERIFEPFFTTKGPARGSGLGLSMVYSFVRQSGGHIRVESKPGAGTIVRLYLPRALLPEDSEAAAASDGDPVSEVLR